MHLFPAIDLRNGQVVRLHQGDYNQQTTYHADPLAQAHAFADAGATWLHIVDLDGARTGNLTHLPVIEKICKQTKLKVEVGGGVRNTQTVDLLLAAGATRVVLGTAALENWTWFEQLAAFPDYQRRLVLGLDARAGKAAVSGWEKQTDLTPIDIARRVSGWSLAAIVYTDIATDGTLAGPNIAATAELAAATLVPVVVSGGVGSLDHLKALRKLPLQGVIVGKALYENKFTVQQAIHALNTHG
jgi:phosphoribosylformimino-5-aminoimidazole carboxamide ribotide isomerase